MDGVNERRLEPRIDAPKMKIGEMDDGAHWLTPQARALLTLQDMFDSATAWSSP